MFSLGSVCRARNQKVRGVARHKTPTKDVGRFLDLVFPGFRNSTQKTRNWNSFGSLSSKNSLCLCAFTTGTCNWRQSHIVLFSSSFCCDSYNECVSRWPAVMCVRSIIGNDKLRPETWESGSVYTHLSTSRPRTTLQGDYLTRRPVNLFLVTPFGFWSMYAFRRSHNE